MGRRLGVDSRYSICNVFSNALNNLSSDCNCQVLYECDWIVSEDTIVRPDVMISCDAKNDDWVTEPPSFILEILSPATVLKDRNTKFKLYQAYGVRYYLIADLGKKLIEIFSLKDNVYQETSDLKSFHLTKVCTIELSVQDLFA
jgi:Uma2 family endonuclease